MVIEGGFIDYIQKKQPVVWAMIENASKDGLIQVDIENDAVTATNRLLWTYPGLHDTLNAIINEWGNNPKNHEEHFKSIINNIKDKQDDN
jgi:hypothetical protein